MDTYLFLAWHILPPSFIYVVKKGMNTSAEPMHPDMIFPSLSD